MAGYLAAHHAPALALGPGAQTADLDAWVRWARVSTEATLAAR